MRLLPVALAVALLVPACTEKSGPVVGAKPPIRDTTARELIEGGAEKGPFVAGEVAIAAADGGEPVVTTVQDGLGRFAAWVPAAPVYRLEVTGRAYRESTGEPGPSPVTLRGLHVGTGEGERVRVNVLTHLAHDRALRLAADGTALDGAIGRAEGEVHRALGLTGAHYTPSRPASAYRLLGADDLDHAYLLAASAVVDAAADGDLPGFLAVLAEDLADDGELDAGHAARLADARRALDPEAVTASLGRWLERTGHPGLTVPNLRRILDSDGDGVPDADESLAVDESRLAVVRHGADRADEAVGSAGAIAAGCPPARVALFDRANGSLPLAEGAVAADGSFAVPFGTPEVSRPRLFLEASDGCGARTARVAIAAGIDETPPVLDPSAFAIVRRGLGETDGVMASAGAVVDPGGAVAAVWLADSADGPRLTRVRPAADGGFAEVPIGTTESSLPRLWAEAVDKAGNLSPRVEIVAGSAVEPPRIDPDAVAVNRRGIDRYDTIAGAPGAATGGCGPVAVRLAGGPLPGEEVTSFAVDEEGGFPESNFGSGYETPAEVWLEAVDKCGRVGPRVEVVAARDHEPPVLDPERLLFHHDENWRGITGLPGAVADPHGRVTLDVYELDCELGPPIVSTQTFRDDGSFGPLWLNPFAFQDDAVCVEVRDKAGNSSGRIRSRRVLATLDFRSFGAASLPELSIFSGALDVDPRTVSPGYLAWTGVDLGVHDVVGRDTPLVARAFAEIRNEPLAWRWIDLSIPAPDVAAAAGPGGDPTVVRTMGDWPWLVTMRRRCEGTGSCASWSWDVVDVEGPPRREGLALAPTPSGDFLAYGGVSATGPLTDTWTLAAGDSDRPWNRVATEGPAASFARMVLDPARATNVLVAAVPDDPLLQVWSRGPSGTWVRIPTVGGPSFRTGFGLAFDELRGTVVLFGGKDAAGTPLGDTWLWTPAGWVSPQPDVAPSPRWGHGMAFWAARGAVYLRGGSQADETDTWAWNGFAWAQVRVGAAGDSPGMTIVADPLADRLFTFSTATLQAGGTPTFTVGAYTGLVTYLETFFLPAGYLQSLDWNPLLQEVLFQPAYGLVGYGGVFQGGWWKGASGPDFPTPGRTVVIDTHRRLRIELGRNDNGQVAATAERPYGTERLVFEGPDWPPGVTPAYVFDALEARTVGVGGGQSWALGEVDFGFQVQTFTPLANAPPGAVELVFDPVRGRVVAYDGTGTWELHGDAWTFVAAAPAACPGGTLVFDPAAGKVLKLAGDGCALACAYDGSWSCGGAQDPEPDLRGAPLVPRGMLIAHGNGPRTWVREGATPHPRHAVQGLAVQLVGEVDPLAARVRVESQGVGFDPEGGPRYGFELQAWNWAAGAWVTIGSASAPGPTEQTLDVPLGAELAAYVRSGRLRFQLVPFGPAAASGALPAQLSTGLIEVEVEYLLPP